MDLAGILTENNYKVGITGRRFEKFFNTGEVIFKIPHHKKHCINIPGCI